MPELNRRRFLQVIGAAGLAPALPALPARAAVPAGVTSAQMLWANMFARAGNVKNATSLASSMGISFEAAQGVYARLVQTQVLAGSTIANMGHMKAPVPAAVNAPTAPTGTTATQVSAPVKPITRTAPKSVGGNLRDFLLEADDIDEDNVADEIPELEPVETAVKQARDD